MRGPARAFWSETSDGCVWPWGCWKDGELYCFNGVPEQARTVRSEIDGVLAKGWQPQTIWLSEATGGQAVTQPPQLI